MTRWEPGVRQESFIQGVKIANLVRKSAAADPFLSCGVSLCLTGRSCSAEDMRTFQGKGFAGFFGFLTSSLIFFFLLCKEAHVG
jgi:hypothetical protein